MLAYMPSVRFFQCRASFLLSETCAAASALASEICAVAAALASEICTLALLSRAAISVAVAVSADLAVALQIQDIASNPRANRYRCSLRRGYL